MSVCPPANLMSNRKFYGDGVERARASCNDCCSDILINVVHVVDNKSVKVNNEYTYI